MRKKFASYPCRRPFLGSIYRAGFRLGLFFILLSVQSEARAQDSCSALRIQQATLDYDFGRFSETFRLLKPCIPDGFEGRTQRTNAYRLMALSYLATDSLDQARESIRFLLRHDSRFSPNPQSDPPLFVSMVSDMRPRWYTWMWKGGEWYKWAGRGLIVGSAVALPMLLKKTPLPLLPDPPSLPPPN